MLLLDVLLCDMQCFKSAINAEKRLMLQFRSREIAITFLFCVVLDFSRKV